MALILSGTDGLSDVDGSAATPAIRGSDANTGIFFPAADTIAFAEGGTESMRLDSSGNVNVNAGRIRLGGGSDEGTQLNLWTTLGGDGTLAAFNIIFNTGANNSRVERARIDSSGNLLVNRTTQTADAGRVVMQEDGATRAVLCLNNSDTSASSQFLLRSIRNGNTVGGITNTNVATAFPTSSDYRLKHDIQPMTGALAKVAALKPCTYKWKIDGADGQGFIAHELAEVCPDAVVGEKDAVNEDGSIKPQGIDTSFLVATLTAAIQELNTKVEELKAEVAALKGAAQ